MVKYPTVWHVSSLDGLDKIISVHANKNSRLVKSNPVKQ